jgi:hypothetical protein
LYVELVSLKGALVSLNVTLWPTTQLANSKINGHLMTDISPLIYIQHMEISQGNHATSHRPIRVKAAAMATQYFTCKYPIPLVVVPIMGLFYKGEECHLRTPLSLGLHRTLDRAVRGGGDFNIERVISGQVLLSIDSVQMGSWTSVHGPGRWNHFMSALVRVQLRVRRLQSRLALVREFQRSDWGLRLPAGIVDEIVHVCFEKKYRQNSNATSVETLSFQRMR